MTEQELIGKQQLQIEEMKEALKNCEEAFRKIRGVIYCVSGPLNDNKLKYTPKQMNDFFQIANLCLDLNVQ